MQVVPQDTPTFRTSRPIVALPQCPSSCSPLVSLHVFSCPDRTAHSLVLLTEPIALFRGRFPSLFCQEGAISDGLNLVSLIGPDIIFFLMQFCSYQTCL